MGAAGASARFPLWQHDRGELMAEMLDAGVVAHLSVIRNGTLPLELLGRVVDDRLLSRFAAAAGIDLAGENGEYHTLVADAPYFRRPVQVTAGERVRRGDVHAVDLLPEEDSVT